MKTMQLVKDKRKHYDTVDKFPSEQQFHKSDAYTFIVQKNWSCSHCVTGSYGRQADRPVGC